jgi:hypothetical protein
MDVNKYYRGLGAPVPVTPRPLKADPGPVRSAALVLDDTRLQLHHSRREMQTLTAKMQSKDKNLT